MKNGLYIDKHGAKHWCIDGNRHRDDGPAIEDIGGTKWWFKNGKRHRKDGPAIEWNSGAKEWRIEGKEYTEEEFNQYLLIKKTCGIKMKNAYKLYHIRVFNTSLNFILYNLG